MEYTREITVGGGVRSAVPVSVLLADAGPVRSVRMAESAGERAVPCQLESTGEGPLLTWVVGGPAGRRSQTVRGDTLGRSALIL